MRSMTEQYTCVLCGKPATGWGNNPAPAAETGMACDTCNAEKVLPMRLAIMNGATPPMTYEQRNAALELGDKLAAFAEQYNLPDTWIKGMYSRAKLAAKKSTGLDINEA